MAKNRAIGGVYGKSMSLPSLPETFLFHLDHAKHKTVNLFLLAVKKKSNCFAVPSSLCVYE